MKTIVFLFTGLLCLLSTNNLSAEIVIEHTKNTIQATSTSIGIEGFKGCDATTAKKTPAYLFKLYRAASPPAQKNKNGGVCSVRNRSSWQEVTTQASNNNQVLFDNLVDGIYKVTVMSGEPLGCTIKNADPNFPNQSIVHKYEESSAINLGESNPGNFISLVEEATPDAFRDVILYPNPAVNEINISIKNENQSSEFTIRIFNLLGQELLFQNEKIADKSYQTHLKMSTQQLSTGTYFLTIEDGNSIFFEEKLIILNME